MSVYMCVHVHLCLHFLFVSCVSRAPQGTHIFYGLSLHTNAFPTAIPQDRRRFLHQETPFCFEKPDVVTEKPMLAARRP